MNMKDVMQALLEGQKITRPTWEPDEYLELKDNTIVNECESECNLMTVNDYSIYKEPKKPVKLYKYAYKYPYDSKWTDTNFYYKDDEDFESRNSTNFFKRLDYTMIEVEEIKETNSEECSF